MLLTIIIFKKFFNYFLIFFLKKLHGYKERFQWKKTPFSTCMQHKKPQSLLVFAVSFTPNFGTFGGVAHPP